MLWAGSGGCWWGPRLHPWVSLLDLREDLRDRVLDLAPRKQVKGRGCPFGGSLGQNWLGVGGCLFSVPHLFPPVQASFQSFTLKASPPRPHFSLLPTTMLLRIKPHGPRHSMDIPHHCAELCGRRHPWALWGRVATPPAPQPPAPTRTPHVRSTSKPPRGPRRREGGSAAPSPRAPRCMPPLCHGAHIHAHHPRAQPGSSPCSLGVPTQGDPRSVQRR